MSEIAEKPLITRVAPRRGFIIALPAEGLKPDRHEIRMQSQFCCLASSGLPPALAMAELERLLKGYDADHSRLLENVPGTAHQQFLKFCEPQKRKGRRKPRRMSPTGRRTSVFTVLCQRGMRWPLICVPRMCAAGMDVSAFHDLRRAHRLLLLFQRGKAAHFFHTQTSGYAHGGGFEFGLAV